MKRRLCFPLFPTSGPGQRRSPTFALRNLPAYSLRMTQPSKEFPAEKPDLHPRNRHRARYDFPRLIQSSPALAAFVHRNPYGNDPIDFANPDAVKSLNQALLKHFYGLTDWDIPAGYLCPPIPGRADYIHHAADLLASTNGGRIPKGRAVKVLDVGVGANCIYPIIGRQEYGWQFVGSDIDPVAIRSARQLVAANSVLAGAIECRLQPEAGAIFEGIIKPGEVFDLVVCNPPFHASAAEAQAGNRRKRQNLGSRQNARPVQNFGGQTTELWCEGGEEKFVRQMVKESALRPTSAGWFTALISKQSTLPGIYKELGWVNAADVQTIEMTQGQKTSRFVAWSFLTPTQHSEWQATRSPKK